MTALVVAILAAIGLTFLGEGTLWLIFRAKMQPLNFPHALDTSYFRFFSLRILGIVTILHTIFVMLCLSALCLYLW